MADDMADNGSVVTGERHAGLDLAGNRFKKLF
jgi:hypothetical protein